MRTANFIPLHALLVVACSACGGRPAEPPAAIPQGPTVTTAPTAVAAPAATEIAGATNDAKTAQHADCSLAARDVPGEEGQKRFVRCPAGCLESYFAVWGTDVYSDDSSVCAAAIHAGAIGPDGGLALFDFLPGREKYEASTRAGVQARSWGAWRRSFQVFALGADGAPVRPTPPAAEASSGCAQRGYDLVSAAKPRAEHVCPASCSPSAVYGSGPYTDDSPVCAAAVHAGIIPSSGGKIVIEHVGKKRAFQGSVRNGVETRSWSSEHESFTVARSR